MAGEYAKAVVPAFRPAKPARFGPASAGAPATVEWQAAQIANAGGRGAGNFTTCVKAGDARLKTPIKNKAAILGAPHRKAKDLLKATIGPPLPLIEASTPLKCDMVEQSREECCRFDESRPRDIYELLDRAIAEFVALSRNWYWHIDKFQA